MIRTRRALALAAAVVFGSVSIFLLYVKVLSSTSPLRMEALLVNGHSAIEATVIETSALAVMLRRASLFSPTHMPRTVIVAPVNSGFIEMAENFVYHCNRVTPPLHNIILVAMDSNCFINLQKRLPDSNIYSVESFVQSISCTGLLDYRI